MSALGLSVLAIAGLLLAVLWAGLESALPRANKYRIALLNDQRKRSARFIQRMLRDASQFYLVTRLWRLVGWGAFALGLYGLAGAALPAAGILLHVLFAVAVVLVITLAEGGIRLVFRWLPLGAMRVTVLLVVPFWLLGKPLAWLSLRLAQPWIRNRKSNIPLAWPMPALAWEYSLFDRMRFQELLPEDEIEEEVFTKALDFNKIRVRDFMVPRTEIIATAIDTPLEAIREKLIEEEVSRIVLYKDSLDDIRGFVHSSAMLRAPNSLEAIRQEVMVVPESTQANALLSRFNQEHRSLAIVVDEYGGTSGLVTIEDLVEVVFGEFEDEHDDPAEHELVEEQLGPQEFRFSARLEVDYINRTFDLDLPVPDEFATLGGLVLQLAERIPQGGEVFVLRGFRFTIEKAASNKLEVIRVVLPTPTGPKSPTA